MIRAGAARRRDTGWWSAEPHGDEPLRAVHDAGPGRAPVATAYDAWMAGGFVELVGQDRVVPYFFPTAAMLGGLPAHRAAAVHAPGRAATATTR